MFTLLPQAVKSHMSPYGEYRTFYPGFYDALNPFSLQTRSRRYIPLYLWTFCLFSGSWFMSEQFSLLLMQINILAPYPEQYPTLLLVQSNILVQRNILSCSECRAIFYPASSAKQYSILFIVQSNILSTF